MRTIDGAIKLALSDVDQETVAEEQNDPEIEPRMH
jgi:hypothetical protein